MSNIADINKFRKNSSSLIDIQIKINKIAQKSENIIYTTHARERLKERGFIEKDVRDILTNGIIRKLPIKDEKGCLRYKVEEINFRGNKDAVVITVICDPNLVVLTVYEVY